jgi:D-methionine transport system permease protein
MLPGLWTVAWQTLTVLAVCLPLAIALGGPLGVLLYQLARAPQTALAQAVHGLCSLPCLIVLLALAPVLGDWLGNRPLALSAVAIPYFARLVAAGLGVVPRGLIESCQAMGASPLQIVVRVMLPEARPALVLAGVQLTAALLAASLLVYQTIAQMALAR